MPRLFRRFLRLRLLRRFGRFFVRLLLPQLLNSLLLLRDLLLIIFNLALQKLLFGFSLRIAQCLVFAQLAYIDPPLFHFFLERLNLFIQILNGISIFSAAPGLLSLRSPNCPNCPNIHCFSSLNGYIENKQIPACYIRMFTDLFEKTSLFPDFTSA